MYLDLLITKILQNALARMSTAKTFFEWWVPYFSGYCIMNEMKEAYFSSIF